MAGVLIKHSHSDHGARGNATCWLEWGPCKPRVARKPTEAGRARSLPYTFQREHGPVNTLVPDFRLPELSGNQFLLLWTIQFVALDDVALRDQSSSLQTAGGENSSERERGIKRLGRNAILVFLCCIPKMAHFWLDLCGEGISEGKL